MTRIEDIRDKMIEDVKGHHKEMVFTPVGSNRARYTPPGYNPQKQYLQVSLKKDRSYSTVAMASIGIADYTLYPTRTPRIGILHAHVASHISTDPFFQVRRCILVKLDFDSDIYYSHIRLIDANRYFFNETLRDLMRTDSEELFFETIFRFATQDGIRPHVLRRWLSIFTEAAKAKGFTLRTVKKHYKRVLQILQLRDALT